ncbi:DUF4244 domain-containing protein [Streptacidiphilus sp. N1-3]|uniref:DUF4244 domain-containing protein n=1 Tax=Streptacidiphilus alkalitolerans TaxID=3342712 RepID=A0ABV6WYY4_9ACTN
MSGTAVLNTQLDRFDALIDAPESHLPLGSLCLQRVKGALMLALSVAQVWTLHGISAIRRRLARFRPDAGMTTAEYAVGTVAACGFAALLYKVVTSGAVSSALNALVTRALHAV